MNTLDDAQNSFLHISSGWSPLTQARDVLSFLRSFPFGKRPGSARSKVGTSHDRIDPAVRDFPVLALWSSPPPVSLSHSRYVLRARIGPRLNSSGRALISMFPSFVLISMGNYSVFGS